MAYDDYFLVENDDGSISQVHNVPKLYDEKSNFNNGGATNIASPSYEALVDQIKQNNAWSAEQAQKQMDFQEKAWREQMDFNAMQAQANRDFQQESANVAMNFSAEEAQKNRDWQEMMSNSAHQREMADLEKAGLNPILAARNGASTGTGASAVSSQAAGSQASSVSTPQGAKGNTDESGTMAIMSLLSRMLDNQVEREKMQNSAEVAFGTADMYTAATRYAAELAQIASMYGSDRSYDASMNNLEHILGQFVNQFMEVRGYNGYSAAGMADAGLSAVESAVRGDYHTKSVDNNTAWENTKWQLGQVVNRVKDALGIKKEYRQNVSALH